MTGPRISFKRIVLDLPWSGRDGSITRFVAEFAELMHLHLLGRFVEDPRISRLAALSVAREFRFLEREWRALDQEGVMRATELAGAATRRMFEQAAKSFSIKHSFQVVCDPGLIENGAYVRNEDIVVLRQRSQGGEPFDAMLQTAFRLAAGVLIVPSRVEQESGPILAIAPTPNDPIVELAAQLAASAGESLLRLGWNSDVSASGLSRGAPAERLVVVGRGTIDDALLETIVSQRGAPILVIEPYEGGDCKPRHSDLS